MRSNSLLPSSERTSPQFLSSRKRRRISLACTSCRRKKSRCDGYRPTCSSCRDLRICCVYEEASKHSNTRREINRGYSHIQPRGDKSHTLIKDQLITIPTGQVPGAPYHTADSTIIEPELANGQETLCSSTSDAQTETRNEIAVDTLATGAFDDISKQNIGYFGPSSNHALFRSLSTVFAQFSRQSFPPRQHHPKITQARQPHGVIHPVSARSSQIQNPSTLDIKPNANNLYAIPNEQDFALLTSHFFDTTSPVLLFISKSTVLSYYKSSQQQNHNPLSRPKLALINAVCAYALYTLRCGNAEKFYDQSLLLLDERTLRGSSLELVQVLLLLSNFQQNNQRSVASWTLHATAVKGAFQLGLHSPKTYEDHGLEDKELCKRVWYAMVNQDRSLSISLGRPFLIAPQHVRVQLPQTPSSILNASPTAMQVQINSLEYFNQTISLNKIKASVIEVLYDYNIDSTIPLPLSELLIKTIQLSSTLSKWRDNCPSSCHILSSPDFSTWTLLSYNENRFNLLLSIQHHVVMLLINGPMLTRFLEENVKERQQEGEIALLLETMIPIIKHDFDTAKELQKLIHAAVTYSETFLDYNSAWWMCNYTILTANLHLFGILLACKTSDIRGIEMTDIRTSLDSGLETLKLVGRTSLMSRKAGDCLAGFLEVFDSLISDPLQQSSTDANLAEAVTPISPSLLAWDMMPENFYSQYIAQSADDFLFHCSDHALLDVDSEFFPILN